MFGFGGADHFYRSHGVTGHTDLGDIAAMVPPADFEAANLGWVVDDQMLLDVALQRHAELTAGEAPVLLFVETSGPHGIEVWMSRRCTGTGRAEVWRDNEAGVRCTGGIVADFVETCVPRPMRGRRCLYFCRITSTTIPNCARRIRSQSGATCAFDPSAAGSGADPVRVIDREAAMIDVYPTILDVLGLIPPGGGAGLGVSLLGDAPLWLNGMGGRGGPSAGP